MNHDPLDDMLARYGKQVPPTASGPTASEIWREIDRRRAHSGWTRLFAMLEWRELFSEPRLPLVAVAFALVVGVVPAAFMGRMENERQLARQSIHFEVFGMEAVSLGSVFARPTTIASPHRP